MFKLQNLTLNRDDKTILWKFHLAVKSGEIYVILGPNGAGKSPLIAIFTVVSTSDEYHFYLNILMWIIKIEDEVEFEDRWLKCKDENGLRNVLLSIIDKQEG